MSNLLDQATTEVKSLVRKVEADVKLATADIPTSLDGIVSAAKHGLTNIGNEMGAISNRIKNIVDLDNISDSIEKALDFESITGEPPFANVLHNYASYNYIFTLSSMNDTMVNFPNETYKQGKLGPIILKSGNGSPNDRIYIEGYGAFDFYIDDVVIDTIMGFDKQVGNTSATTIKFKVYETYSMGLFFDALQEAAKQAGFKNYLLAPYLLTLQFMGHVSPTDLGVSGDSLSPIEKTNRHIPITINTMEMSVTGSGSVYDVEALVMNERALSNTYVQLKNNISISGKTVHEMLQSGTKSLQTVLNDRLLQEAKNNGKQPDQILILFPNDPASGTPSKQIKEVNESKDSGATINPASATADINVSITEKLRVAFKENGQGMKTLIQETKDVSPLGKVSMAFDSLRKGESPFPADVAVYDEKKHIFVRGNMEMDPNTSDMRFGAGTSVIDVINQVMIMSDYGRQQLKKEQVSKTGKIKWFRILPQVYIVPTDDNYNVTGFPPQLIVYNVIPYGTSIAKTLPPGKASKPEHVAEAKKQVVREYDYIYTGKNLDIIDFELKFNAGFYQAMDANSAINSGDAQRVEKASDSSIKPQKEETKQVGLSDALHDKAELPAISSNESIMPTKTDQKKTAGDNSGGGGLNTADTLLAKRAHEIILNNPVDMITPTLTILGDPYYLGDSGFGNFVSKQLKGLESMNADHSIDYVNNEVHIIVNFRTPIDIDMSTGTYDFGTATRVVDKFSGLYQVTTCSNNFSKGKFTQQIELMRIPGQNATTEQK